ncbi:MAG: acyltransferase [Zoogloeaceae bacterium]|jgi:peptidoglycan/LPS O-acetylase OafA/YrhL|nr:acyltransferase [Zoogloeaceae bacterium]
MSPRFTRSSLRHPRIAHHNPHLVYRPDIDGMRAVAVLAVLLFHAFPDWLPGGFVGVDIFFVISGYLISSIIFRACQKGNFSFTNFYARRIRRIFPALLLVVGVSLVLGYTVLFPDEYAQLAKHALGGLGFAANLVFWSETGYFDTDAELKPFLHLWSLGIEEQFYLFWPPIVLCAWRFRRYFAWIPGGLFFLSLAACVIGTSLASTGSYFLLPTRAWELLAGAILAYRVAGSGPVFARSGIAAGSAALGACLVLASFWLIDRNSPFPGWRALLPVGGTVLVIAAGEGAWVNRGLLARGLAVGIGRISFPLYLWHWPLLVFPRILGWDQSAVARAAALALAVLLSWLSYRLVESPARLRGGKRTVIALVAVSVVLAALSANILTRDGLRFRLKDAQAKAHSKLLEWDDEKKVYPDNCDAWLKTDLPRMKRNSVGARCHMADPARAPNAVIIGDSHAEMFYWGLARALSARGVNLAMLEKSACPPFYGVVFFEGDELVNNCREWMDPIIDFVASRPEIETVFLGGRWVTPLLGNELKDRPGRVSKTRMTLPGHPGLSTAMSGREVFSLAFEEALKRLRARGKKLVFLHDVPELPYNVRECLAWRPNRFINRVPRPECVVSREIIDRRGAEFRPTLENILAKFPEITIADPVPIMCDARVCHGRRDQVLLYRDDDHLSMDGSYWVGERLIRQIFDARQAASGSGAR